jgi:hypothetical protein
MESMTESNFDDNLMPPEPAMPSPPQKPLARVILASFVLTFIASRGMVILIMARKVPDFFLHVGQTHVHHLNYGIFLLSGVGAYLLLRRPTGRALSTAALAYGIGLALTFDEFGMWLHLGGSYWQRASFDAVVTITAVLGLISVMPAIRRFRPRHWVATIVLAIALLAFAAELIASVYRFSDTHFSQYLHNIEESGPG